MKWMFLPFVRMGDYSGRSGRREYWMFHLLEALCGILLALVLLFTGVLISPTLSSTKALLNILDSMPVIIALIVYLFCFLPAGIALSVRRWHDIGNSGWTIVVVLLLSRIPVIGPLVWLVNFAAMCWPGDKGANKYGFPPPDSFPA